jgi:uncharacterized protein with HEPN domain
MKLEIKKLLFDIKTSIDSVFEYLGPERDFYAYQNNKQLRRAVEREIEIIGEAVNRLLKNFPEVRIEYGRQIVNTRNFVIHAYDAVDNVIVWGIVTNHLPNLLKEVEQLLKTDY